MLVSPVQALLSLLCLSLLRFDASAQAVVLLEKNAMSKTSAAVMNVATAAYPISFVEHILAGLMDKYYLSSIDIGRMTIQWTVSPSQMQVNLLLNLLSHLLALESLVASAADAGNIGSLGCHQLSSESTCRPGPSRSPVLEPLGVSAANAGNVGSLGCLPPCKQAAPLLSCENRPNGSYRLVVILEWLKSRPARVLEMFHARLNPSSSPLPSPPLSEEFLFSVLQELLHRMTGNVLPCRFLFLSWLGKLSCCFV